MLLEPELDVGDNKKYEVKTIYYSKVYVREVKR